MTGRIVEVRIDELVLAGIAPGEREHVAAVASRELERLLGERGEWTGGATVVADIVGAEIPPGATAGDVGLELARAVQRELAS